MLLLGWIPFARSFIDNGNEFDPFTNPYIIGYMILFGAVNIWYTFLLKCPECSKSFSNKAFIRSSFKGKCLHCGLEVKMFGDK